MSTRVIFDLAILLFALQCVHYSNAYFYEIEGICATYPTFSNQTLQQYASVCAPYVQSYVDNVFFYNLTAVDTPGNLTKSQMYFAQVASELNDAISVLSSSLSAKCKQDILPFVCQVMFPPCYANSSSWDGEDFDLVTRTPTCWELCTQVFSECQALLSSTIIQNANSSTVELQPYLYCNSTEIFLGNLNDQPVYPPNPGSSIYNQPVPCFLTLPTAASSSTSAAGSSTSAASSTGQTSATSSSSTVGSGNGRPNGAEGRHLASFAALSAVILALLTMFTK